LSASLTALIVKVSPERTVDGGVEMLATRASDGQKLAVEHTLIEPFVGEKTDFHSHYQVLARQLKADESLQVPGFSIAVEARERSAVRFRLARNHQRRTYMAASREPIVSCGEGAAGVSMSSPSRR
jgi:hypothetical protein